MNRTYVVSTYYNCEEYRNRLEGYRPDQLWRITAIGCKLLMLLQEMYPFQMTYIDGFDVWNSTQAAKFSGNLPDIFSRPFAVVSEALKVVTPLAKVIDRRYGFILHHSKSSIGSHRYFSVPFTPTAWHYYYVIIFIIAIILYLLSRWEKQCLRDKKQEHSFSHELLVVFGGICQHIPPVEPLLGSRRIAYCTFFFFCFILYNYYTSNLLSHLVNDKNGMVSLEDLCHSNYRFIAIHNVNPSITVVHEKDRNLSTNRKLQQKIASLEILNVHSAIKAIVAEEAALVTDFTTVYPYIKNELSDEDICRLVEVILIKKIQEYLFVSKQFPLLQEFKTGLLRITETGILKKIKKLDIYARPICEHMPNTEVSLNMITFPLAILGTSFFVSTLILICEKIHYARCHRLYPYVN